MTFWKGAFNPHLKKWVEIRPVIPIEEMEESDWLWLDYLALRVVAQNRIAEIAADEEGGIEGFVPVVVPTGKGLYLVPVPIGGEPEPLTNAPDDQPESEVAQRLRLLIERIEAFEDEKLRALIALIIKMSDKEYARYYAEWDIDAASVAIAISLLLYYSLTETETLVDELIDVTTTGEASKWFYRWSGPPESEQIAASR